MLSLPDARRLFENARNEQGLLALAAALGFTRSTPVGPELQQKLGIAGLAESFTVCESRGILRAMLMTFSDSTSPRETLSLIAARLSATVPHILWIVLSSDRDTHVGVSVWTSDSARPRVFALLADPGRISDSDAQTLCALAATSSSSESLTHLRWTEILGREAITVRFFRALRSVVDGLSDSLAPGVSPSAANDLSLVFVSRLLFLSFIENKGWLNGDHDFLSNTFIQCISSGGGYHRKVLSPLFFGTLNTPVARRAAHARKFGKIPFLNGGLFGRSPAERLVSFEFPDDALGTVFGDLLTRYRFTGHEQGFGISDSAIDPEILGRAFESLMNTASRKATGAFYTPQPVVNRVADAALETILEECGLKDGTVAALLDGMAPPDSEARLATRAISELRILDPACGSGAFLVYLLEKLASLRAVCGDRRPASERRREVLANTIFGVDINPTAVWLCELRLWLSVVVESDSSDPTRVMPLPNLDRNIRVGDSLGSKPIRRVGAPPCTNLQRTRLRYTRSIGARKKLLGRVLEKMERRYAIALLTLDVDAITQERRDLIAAARSRNLFGERTADSAIRNRLAVLRTLRAETTRSLHALKSGSALPFSFDTHFADVMQAGGFHLVVGNPPWVRIHQISRASRETFKKNFELCGTGGWDAGARRANAGSGFAHQLDLSALFVERALNVLRENGCVAFLLPAKLWKSLAGGSVRALITRASNVRLLEDFSGAKSMFDATTYPSLLVAMKRSQPDTAKYRPVRTVVHRRTEALHWELSAAMLPLDSSIGSPWIMVPHEVRSAFDIVAAHGTPMADSPFGRPLLGVKTGSNAAYILELIEDMGPVTRMKTGDTTVDIESRMLRKVITGDSIETWRIKRSRERIIWTHASDGQPLPDLPPLAMAWFKDHRRELMSRSDARTETLWWRVFRTEASNNLCDRVVWSDIGRSPRAVVIPAGDDSIPMNSCYVVACGSAVDARALAALINSPLVAAWLSLIAEPAQGGYKRYLGWTMAMLPVPKNWRHARVTLARLYTKAINGDTPSPNELFTKTVAAYGLSENDVHDLMVWAQQ